MKNSVIFNLKFTISKLMGIFIILGGLALGFYNKDNSVAITLVTVGAGLITVKTIVANEKH